MISIKGLSKAEVLKALYHSAHIKGFGFLDARREPLTVEECEALLAESTYFDYLYGRVMKVDLSGNEFDERLYDRDNGAGAAANAIAALRKDRKVIVSIDLLEGIQYNVDPLMPVLKLRFDSVKAIDKVIFLLKNAREQMGGGEELPSRFAQEMRQICEKYEDDREVRHVEMDELMCRTLKNFGFIEGVEVFEETAKWYA